MKLKFNAPVTFGFALACMLVLSVELLMFPGFIGTFFTGPGKNFQAGNPGHYLGIVTHVFGHENWTHLWNNLLFLLLLGPILEEKYAPRPLLVMMAITTLVTGLFNVLLAQPPLLGASAIVFMMIMLVSFARAGAGDIPVSFLLILILYMLAELTAGATNKNPNVSNLSHIVGGICGVIFGFLKMSSGSKPAAPGPGPGPAGPSPIPPGGPR